MPELQHSVDMKLALGLLPAIWLSQSVLSLLVQCQQGGRDGEIETETDRKTETESEKITYVY